jgi:hypothetical protein
MLDRQIDRRLGECRRQGRRCGGQRVTHGTGRHADRTEQVSLVTIVMTLRPAVIGRGEGGYLGGKAVVDRMNVTKGQAEIDGERKQRKPRTTPDMVTKPMHCGRTGFFLATMASGPFLVGPPKWSIRRITRYRYKFRR